MLKSYETFCMFTLSPLHSDKSKDVWVYKNISGQAHELENVKNEESNIFVIQFEELYAFLV